MLLYMIRLIGGEPQRGIEVLMLAQMKIDSTWGCICQKMSIELVLGYNIIL